MRKGSRIPTVASTGQLTLGHSSGTHAVGPNLECGRPVAETGEGSQWRGEFGPNWEYGAGPNLEYGANHRLPMRWVAACDDQARAPARHDGL